MKQVNKLFILCIIGFLFAAPAYAKQDSEVVRMIPASFATLAKKAKPSVVNIQTVKTIKGRAPSMEQFFGFPFGNNKELHEHFFGPFMHQPRDRKEESLGSGFIITENGYIVTNYHVIKDADEIKVIMYDKQEYKGEIVGTDKMTDIALLKINAEGLDYLEFGSSDNTTVGSWVVAIGSPFGLEQTVTAGIISAKERVIGSGPFDDFLQTDAAINFGNSGGPLLNLKGEVIGINTAIIKSGQGIGFAIPSDLATGIIAQLTDHKSVSRGWLGVSIINFEEAGDKKGKRLKGVYVEQAYKTEPAGKAGVMSGDIIYQINNRKVESTRDLMTTIAGSSVGEVVKVHLLRDGKKKVIKVKLGKRPDKKPHVLADENGSDTFGMSLKTMTPEIAGQLGLSRDSKGLVVTSIKSDSRMGKIGVRRGDVLIKIDNIRIENQKDFIKYLDSVKKGEEIRLIFKRGNRNVFRVDIHK